MEKNKDLKIWVLIIGVLVILGASAFAVVLTIQQVFAQASRAIEPVQNVTSNIGTEVSRVLHPTPTILPDPVTVISQIRSLARLETIEFTVEKVITAETGPAIFSGLFGDRIIFIAHGLVIAGVDLQRLGPEDMRVKDGVLYVRLPESEVFIATLDNDKSYVYNRQTGIFTHGDVNLETAARQAAEEEIKKAALEDRILPLAQQNAENYLYRLLLGLGFKEVVFEHSIQVQTPTPAP